MSNKLNNEIHEPVYLFKCAICEETKATLQFQATESLAEAAKTFPSIPMNEMDEVCDECYKKAKELVPEAFENIGKIGLS